MSVPGYEFVTLKPDLRVAAPGSLDRITHYVLREQGDWFEDELAFVRRLMQPGMQAVDIGANYGVYSLVMGQLVSPGGKVWAFEPTHATAELLDISVRENGLTSIEIVKAGLSDHEGEATLYLRPNSELNTLNPGSGGRGATETVHLRTLDACAAEFGWKDIAFVKLDAEGEEVRILDGGKAFFASNDPLYLFELKHGSVVNEPLLDALQRRGLALFRLIPGLNVLVPFSRDGDLEPFLLNLFACSPGRAARCAERELLVHGDAGLGPTPATDFGMFESLCGALPYARSLAGTWAESVTEAVPGRDVMLRALSRYALSRDDSASAGHRVAALQAAFDDCVTLLGKGAPITRLLSAARIAAEFGQRMFAVQVMGRAITALESGEVLDEGEPFLSPNPRFDDIDPCSDFETWALAATVEQVERLAHYSSFYTREESLRRLQFYEGLGFPSPEMERRLELVRARGG